MPGDEEASAAEKPEEEAGRFKTCCYAFLDFIALIVRGIVAVCAATVWCIKRCWYPIKESFHNCWDSFGKWYNPYKKREPAQPDVPGFATGALGSSASSVPGFQYR